MNTELLSSIPDLTIPAAAFRPYVLHGDLLVVSGQLPMKDGKPVWVGRVPDEISVEQAKEAAVLCCRHVLSWVKHACGGDFAKVERCLRLGGFVQTADGFNDAPGIINAASAMMTDAFGQRGEHSRVALGVASLPFGAPVEIEATFAIKV
jgi:enamine deaminase RidA (YjgF/YER057c/UK114 family)